MRFWFSFAISHQRIQIHKKPQVLMSFASVGSDPSPDTLLPRSHRRQLQHRHSWRSQRVRCSWEVPAASAQEMGPKGPVAVEKYAKVDLAFHASTSMHDIAWSMEFSVWSFHSWINLWIISYNIFWSEMSGLGKFVHFLKQMFVFPFLPFVVLFSSCLTNCFPCTWFSRQSQIPVNRYARYFKLSQHTVKLDDKAFAWWNGPANISLTNDLSKKYM